MKNKAITVTVSVLLLAIWAAVLSLCAFAREETPSGLVYQEAEDGTYIITGYAVYQKKITIPAEIEGTPVSAIAPYAFTNNEKLTEIVIEAEITSVPANAFTNCSVLRSVVLPDSVTTIERDAFAGCSLLETITLPDGLLIIGDRAFQGCIRLRSLTIPSSVCEIGKDAFITCESLVLNCDNNAYAMEYAHTNNISTDLRQSSDYIPYLVVILSLCLAVILVIIIKIINITNKKK